LNYIECFVFTLARRFFPIRNAHSLPPARAKRFVEQLANKAVKDEANMT